MAITFLTPEQIERAYATMAAESQAPEPPSKVAESSPNGNGHHPVEAPAVELAPEPEPPLAPEIETESIFEPSTTLTRPKELSIMGLAARFHEQYYKITRYNERRDAFFNYEKGTWTPSRGAAELKVQALINQFHDEVKSAADLFEALRIRQKAGEAVDLSKLGQLGTYVDAAEKFLKAIKNPTTMTSVLAFVRSGIPIGADSFDPDPRLLNLANGAYCLRSGEFREHRATDLCSMQSGVRFDPAGQCARWLRLLQEVFLGDRELIDFIQRAVGYSLTAETSESVFFLLLGDGANGKTEIFFVLEQLMGIGASSARAKKADQGSTYLQWANVESFMDDRPAAGHNDDIARLRGARVVLTAETEKTKRLGEALIKRLTGGDIVTASHKNEKAFQYMPRFKVWLAGNHEPQITGNDYGMWRRILKIPFAAKFVKPGRELGKNEFRIDPNLRRDLLKELPGILNWAIAGYRAWVEQGLNPPSIVRKATDDYQKDSDKVGLFLADELEENGETQVAFSAVYEAYTRWSEQGGLRPMSKISLSKDLTTRGMEIRRSLGRAQTTTLFGWQLRQN